MEWIGANEDWAFEQFSRGELGDRRRCTRAVGMLRRALATPGGRLSVVFRQNAELQGAYDFVQGPVASGALIGSIAAATCAQLEGEDRAYVIVDGTSLTLTDRRNAKGFGSIGRRALPTRGLKVLDALVVSADHVPVGLIELHWWARGKKSGLSRYDRRRRGLTETKHWVDTIRLAATRMAAHAASCAPCFVIDREGDNAEILRTLQEGSLNYIVRAAQDRRVVTARGRPDRLRALMRRQRVIGHQTIDVPAAPGRRARRAILQLRQARVELDLPDRSEGGRFRFTTNVVWVVEQRAPHGQRPLDWMLLNSDDVNEVADAERILKGYCARWRIEEFHRTWKSGHCNVEDSQLHKMEHVTRWATLLAAVATRVEQLKHLSRTTPDAPASSIMSELEIEALKAAKMRQKKRTEVIPERMPTVAEAVRWIADLGGYTGKSSGGPPGSITIGRGLEWLAAWTSGYASGAADRKK